MTHYLIEFRFHGRAKAEIKTMIHGLNRKFHVNTGRSRRPVPHISLAGPFTTGSQSQLVRDFRSICETTPFCSFKVQGFGTFPHTRVVFINIKPSEKLKEFRWRLAQNLGSYCRLKDFDYKEVFEFHATLAMKLSPSQFSTVKEYVEILDPPKYKQFLLRATLIKNSKILYEYDFLQRRMLSRREAQSRTEMAQTKKLLEDFFAGRHDPDSPLDHRVPSSGFDPEEIGTGEIEIDDIYNDEIELEGSDLEEIEPEDTDLEEIDAEEIEPETNDKSNTVDRIKHLVDQLLKRSRREAIGYSPALNHSPPINRPDSRTGQPGGRIPRAFIFSDTHFDHENIIRYCHRPFSDRREMNNVLLEKWNSTVCPEDTIYFLGDLAYGRGSRPTDYWLDRLNGKIVFIEGSHDKSRQRHHLPNYVLRYNDIEFYLVHNPYDAPLIWNGWIVHGHKHNNKLAEYPFMNFNNRHINVSAELLDYQPIELSLLYHLIKTAHPDTGMFSTVQELPKGVDIQ